MQSSYLVIVMVVSSIVAMPFAVLDKVSAEIIDIGCPTGQAPIVGADGIPMKDASGNLQCSPIDAFNNLFGK